MVTGERGPQDLPLTLGSEDVPTSLVALRPYKVVEGEVGKVGSSVASCFQEPLFSFHSGRDYTETSGRCSSCPILKLP